MFDSLRQIFSVVNQFSPDYYATLWQILVLNVYLALFRAESQTLEAKQVAATELNMPNLDI